MFLSSVACCIEHYLIDLFLINNQWGLTGLDPDPALRSVLENPSCWVPEEDESGVSYRCHLSPWRWWRWRWGSNHLGSDNQVRNTEPFSSRLPFTTDPTAPEMRNFSLFLYIHSENFNSNLKSYFWNLFTEKLQIVILLISCEEQHFVIFR